MIKQTQQLLAILACSILISNQANAQQSAAESQIQVKEEPIRSSEFIKLLSSDDPIYAETFLERLDNQWRNALTPMVFETMN